MSRFLSLLVPLSLALACANPVAAQDARAAEPERHEMPGYAENALFVSDDGELAYLVANMTFETHLGVDYVLGDFSDGEEIGVAAIVPLAQQGKYLLLSSLGDVIVVTVDPTGDPDITYLENMGGSGFVILF